MRPRAAWTGILIYLFPAMMDMVLAQILFINPVRAARLTSDPRLITGLIAAWGITYMIACPVVGKFLTTSNASKMLIASCIGTVVLSLAFPLMPSLTGMYLLVSLFGILIALFFPPFQVFMKAVDAGSEKPIAYSTGMYTFSWSFGFALGPLISGLLMDTGPHGWMVCYGFSGLISALAALGIILMRHHAHPPAQAMSPSAPLPSPLKNNLSYRNMPNLAWLAWISAGGALVAISVIRSLFPAEGELVLKLSPSLTGGVLFVLSFVQALTGLALCRSRLWMYHSLPIALFGLLGLAGLICFVTGTTLPILFLGATLFGIFAGSFYFYFVFHAIAHPVKAGKYVAINETVVGLTCIIAPLLAGVTANYFSYSLTYAGAAVILAVILTYQVITHQRYPAGRLEP